MLFRQTGGTNVAAEPLAYVVLLHVFFSYTRKSSRDGREDIGGGTCRIRQGFGREFKSGNSQLLRHGGKG